VCVIKKRTDVQTRTFRYIGQQSISDILFASAAIVQPYVCSDQLVNMVNGDRFSRLQCEIVVWTNLLGFHSSPWFLTITALDRFLAVYRPFQEPFPFKLVVTIIWSIVIFADSLLIVDMSIITYFKSNGSFNGCFQAFPELTNNWFVQSLTNFRISNMLTYIVPLISIGTLSIALIIQLIRLERVGVQSSPDQMVRDERQKVLIIRMILLIIFVYYALTGMPIYFFVRSTFGNNRHTCKNGQFQASPFLCSCSQ